MNKRILSIKIALLFRLKLKILKNISAAIDLDVVRKSGAIVVGSLDAFVVIADGFEAEEVVCMVEVVQVDLMLL